MAENDEQNNKNESIEDESFDTEDENHETASNSFLKHQRSYILVILIALMFAVFAYFGYKYVTRDSEQTNKSSVAKETDNQAKSPQYFDLEEFVVNLNSNSDKEIFLRAKVTIKLSPKANPEELSSKVPVIREEINQLVRQVRPDELKQAGGLEMLKTEILKRVQKVAGKNKIENILFQDIVIT